MAIRITAEQTQVAAEALHTSTEERFGVAGVKSTVVQRLTGPKNSFVRIECPSQHWLGLAKWLRFDEGVDNCSMVSGIDWEQNGWEVVYHLSRTYVDELEEKSNGAATVRLLEELTLSEEEIPLEIEVKIMLPNDSPKVASVQSVWRGADWNEKETWDLVGIEFEGHVGMRRVLNPPEVEPDFHPLQKSFKLRYHDFDGMYDDPQGFGRKAADEGREK